MSAKLIEKSFHFPHEVPTYIGGSGNIPVFKNSEINGYQSKLTDFANLSIFRLMENNHSNCSQTKWVS